MNPKQNHPSRINPIDIDDLSSINEIITQFDQAGVFGPGRIAKAVNIYSNMLKEKATVFLGVAGALVPGGMRKILTNMIKNEMVHVIVSTGANATHDIIEAVGGQHVKDIPYESDVELRNKSIDRIYDAFVADDSFGKLEDKIQPIYREIWEEFKDENKTLAISTSDLLFQIGKRLDDSNSFVRAAYEKNIPIFIPALSDSVLGLQLWLFSQMNRTLIDSMDDLGKIQRIARDAEKAGVLFLGGGVPKNYIFQSRLMSPKTFDYAIQITMDRVETGGLSGASLNEAISWGKVGAHSTMVNVVSDITIALPLIYAGTLAKLKD